MKKVTLSALLLMIALLVVACGGTTEGTTGGTTGGETGGESGGTTQDVTVEGLSTLKWEPAQLTANAGDTLNVTMTTDGVLEHNFIWADQPDVQFLHTAIGETEDGPASRTFDTAGTYEYYCNIPGHREAGMVGTLTVQ